MTSANKYANGTNQNAGNVITDRSTTRIHHAPGGASSLSLGDGSNEDRFASRAPAAKPTTIPGNQLNTATSQQNTAPAKTAQQIYAEELKMQIDAKNALKANQRAAAVEADRADDARVQREAAQLRGEVEGEVAKQRQREAVADQRTNELASYLEQDKGAKGYGGAKPSTKENIEVSNTPAACTTEPAKAGHMSSNRFATGSNQNCGNVITDRSTTRIHHAPGGKSSLVLG